MSKYIALTKFLADYDAGIWEPTFAQIEGILGFELPASARQYPAWWSNQMRSQSMAWQSAGWKTTGVDTAREKLTFVRVDASDDDGIPSVHKLTISDAKLGLAANFGVSPDQVNITIRG